MDMETRDSAPGNSKIYGWVVGQGVELSIETETDKEGQGDDEFTAESIAFKPCEKSVSNTRKCPPHPQYSHFL